ncbi:MAG: hypothetical protein BWX94_00126 [Tenericutes bacterium ADurb.Bin140]|nr:MAG: hypothetical protein BWX94_00126 [Tenericutes bacterium ADurb.Bin140]
MDNTVKKSHWPKWLTFKRTLFIVLFLGVTVFLLIYFLGGYKPLVEASNTRPFSKEGFLSYAELEEMAYAEVDKWIDELPYEENDTWETKITSLRYSEQKSALENAVKQERTAADNKRKALAKDVTTLNQEIATLKAERQTKIDGGMAEDDDEIKAIDAQITSKETEIAALNDEIAYWDSEYDRFNQYTMDLFALVLPKRDVYRKNQMLASFTFEKMFENADYAFYFNKRNTMFKLVEKATGVEWYSNPQVPDDFNDTPVNSEIQKSTINLYYIGSKGSTKLYNSYTYSVSDIGEDKDEIQPNFFIKIDGQNNSVQVLYIMEKRGIDYTYFPYRISKERLEEVLARNEQLIEEGLLPEEKRLTAWEISLIKTEYFELKKETMDDGTVREVYYRKGSVSPSDIKLQIRKDLYEYLYVRCGYTQEESERDNAEFNVEIDIAKPKFEIAIEYQLTEYGLKTTLLANSIVETPEYPIANIDILPYFTIAHHSNEGYMIIPDGSGAIMNYNNGKTTYNQYSQRIYGKDLAKKQQIKPSATEQILLPMFATVNLTKQSGLLVDVIQGAPQLLLTADISKRTEAYNKIYYSAFLRESQRVTIGTGWYATEHFKWTKEKVQTDIVLDYYVLKASELTYSQIAKKYRGILMNRYQLTENDTTDKTVLNIDLLGVYDYRNDFLGIGYTDKKTLTTFKQAMEIVDTLTEFQEDINIIFRGWRKEGLIDESFQNMSYSKLLGRKKVLDELIEKLEGLNIDLYPFVNFGEVNQYQERFGRNYYTARDVASDIVQKYPFDPSTYLFDKTKKPIYPVSPRFYERFMQNIVEDYDFGFDNMAFGNLGSAMVGDYKKRNEFTKYSAMLASINSLEMANNRFAKMALYSPYDFALPYTSIALDVPYTSSTYEIFDYSIPFYQMVISGLFDYSGMVVNANDEKGLNFHVMHILETGSNVHFVFSYEDSAKLIQTDYNYYYYTQFSKWLEDVKELTGIINEIGIHGKELMSHELVGINTYRVIYENTHERVTIYLNYSDAVVVADGIAINPLSYVYQKGVL